MACEGDLWLTGCVEFHRFLTMTFCEEGKLILGEVLRSPISLLILLPLIRLC